MDIVVIEGPRAKAEMNQIQLRSGLPELPEDLLLARDRGEVLFIVGAGASYPAPSDLPGFDGLVENIYAEVDPTMVEPIKQVRAGTKWEDVKNTLNDHQRTELKFYNDGEFDVVLGMLERRIDGDTSKASTMRAAADKVLGRAKEPNRLHKALVVLGQRYGQTTLVTTNFDRLLSVAATQLKRADIGYGMGQIPRPSRGTDFGGIMHIHGMFPYKKQPGSQLILTDQDFGDNYLRRQTITSFLYDAARIFRLVLVGYSANDSPVRYLLNAIAADERHFVDLKPRYAFVGCSVGDTRTPTEWRARGITPIPYDKANGHQALGDVLVEWSKSIPTTANAHNLAARLKAIAKILPDSPEGTLAVPVLEYLARRSSNTERRELAKALSDAGAHPSWLTVLNGLAREDARSAVT